MFKEVKDEAGFSLIELAVSCGILCVITMLAIVSLTAAADDMKGQIQDVKDMQAASDSDFVVEFL